jgi:hypothetical protein
LQLPTFLASLLVFWLAAGQRLSSFFTWVRHSWWLSADWTDAESTFARGEGVEELAWIVGAIALVALLSRLLRDHRRFERIILLPSCSILFFTVFKASFVRYDDQHAPFARAFLVASLLLVAAASDASVSERTRRVGRSLAVALCVVLILANLTLVPSAVPASPRQLARAYAANRAALRAALPPLPATTFDTVPFRAVAGLDTANYHPRPLLQSYLGYSASLSRLDADHLATDGAKTLLFELAAYDGKLAATEDPLYWLELLRWYDVTTSSPLVATLTRRVSPRKVELQQSVRQSVNAGAWVVAPSSHPLWARIDVHPTLLGRLGSFFYKIPPLEIELETSHGIYRRRVMRAVGECGFIVSPFIHDVDGVTRVLRGDEGESVKRFRVLAPGTALYRSDMTVTIDTIEVTPR